MKKAWMSCCAAAALSCLLPCMAGETLMPKGKKPEHCHIGSGVPNQEAMESAIWTPGLGQGYVPQGLAWSQGKIYMSSYQSSDLKNGKGPCRIFEMDPATGAQTGIFDLPASCTHAGGLASVGDGRLVLADKKKLFLIDVKAAFGVKNAKVHSRNAILSTVGLHGSIDGSFVDYNGVDLFIGSYSKNKNNSYGYYFPMSIFDSTTHWIDESGSISRIVLPVKSQGGTFDSLGNIWTTSSGELFGYLYKLDAKTGLVFGQYPMPIGVEDTAFGPDGKLWVVSESGAIKWSAWKSSFPVIFSLNIAKLRSKK